MMRLPLPADPLRRALAVAAGLLAVAAGVSGDPHLGSRPRVDLAALAADVEREADHVDALELAQWIRDGREGLRVIDVRSAEEFEEYHVPTAENLPLSALVEADLPPKATIVLYSEGGPHAAQGWFFLRARGYRNVYFLRGGLYEWATEVMSPVLPDGASREAEAAFAEAAEVSRYFGGVPRRGGPAPGQGGEATALPRSSPHEHGPAAGETDDAVARVRRRSC